MGLLAKTIVTGKLEKANPLPPGSYWLDVFDTGGHIETWHQWVNAAGSAVKVVTTEVYEADESEGYPARTWVQFDVSAPVPWNRGANAQSPSLAIDLGWPNVEKVTPKTSDDTVEKPKAGSPLDILKESGGPDLGWVKWAVGGAVILGGLYTISRFVKE